MSSPTRTVHVGDALAFLAAPLPPGHALVTSLPDVSEVPTISDWQAWFRDAAARCCAALADDAVAIFYQTDIKHEGAWVDKSYLVQAGAYQAKMRLLWHRIVCRNTPGTITFGRPAYAHLLCFSRTLRLSPGYGAADVMPELGHMTWSRAMPTAACDAAMRYITTQTTCHTIVDPFCGLGTALAAANAYGLHAVGVELSRKRAAKAKTLTLP